jgi:putative transposase
MATKRILHPGKTIYGYARVSTIDQNPDRQVHTINEFVKDVYGEPLWEALSEGEGFITIDKVSGATKAEERAGLSQILDRLKPHDVLVTPKIERLARDIEHFRDIRKVLKEKRVILIFAEEIEQLSTPATLDGKYPANAELDVIQEIIETVIVSLAALERKNILARQAQGIARAKERGVYKKPKTLTNAKLEEIKEKLALGIPKAEVARQMKISRATLHRYLNGTVTPDK